ncbi:MAG: DUF839 domain-containing protein [Pseudomonadota bacterium]|nr:DUF839 domain-containing protein [Pseudomonadota bacterium]
MNKALSTAIPLLATVIQAQACPLASLDGNLNLTLPCVQFDDTQFNLSLTLKYIFPAEVGASEGLYWQLAGFEDSSCQVDSMNCATLDPQLNITVPFQSIDNHRHTASLEYYPTPDNSGFYWKLLNETVNSLAFSPVKVPETDAEKRAVFVSDTITLNGKSYDIDFHTILRSGTRAGDHVFGQLIDAQGQPIVAEDGSPRISNDNDFASLLPVGDKIFMVSHFESRPGAMYLTELNQDPNNGLLTALSTRPIDFSDVKGGWVHCAGSVTPWNTHLGSEEYEPDADKRDAETGSISDYYDAMADYYGGDLLQLDPYDYGYPIEVTVFNEAGDYKVAKHYAMGRLAFELAYVMPDQKTVYLSDDGTNVGLFMFIADRAMDLSAGTLYAAQWQQSSAENGGRADLNWISLGHATHAEIAAYLEQNIRFNDIFEKVEPSGEGVCPSGYTSINAGHEADQYGNYHRCLKLKPGMERAASRLETRRYAAMLGATTELRKEEGISFNPLTNTLYVALSEVSRGMEDVQKNGEQNNTYDVGGYNHVKLPYNLCGGVYALDVGADEAIGSDYVAQNMYGLVMGRMTQASDPNSPIPAYDPAGPFARNKCDLEGLANPDNITYITGYNTLIIGEDTGSGHQNDFIWAYNLKDQKLTRIMTTPYGSETTSPYIYHNINGFGYLTAVIQHPFGESDTDQLNDADEAFAYTGYIGPLPALK